MIDWIVDEVSLSSSANVVLQLLLYKRKAWTEAV